MNIRRNTIALILIIIIISFNKAASAEPFDYKLYDRLEEKIEWPDHNLNNPFTDVELLLNVEAPANRKNGSSFAWMGFFDGDGKGGQTGDIWKFRLMMDTPGIWKVTAIFVISGTRTPIKNAPKLPVYSYNVSNTPAANKNGHITIDPQNHLRFSFVNGKQWVPFPIHSSTLLDISLKDAKNWISHHAALGVNALTVRFHAENNPAFGADSSFYQFPGREGKRVHKWSKENKDLFDYTRFDLLSWAHNEKIIEYADSLNIMLSVWFGISGINRQYWTYGPVDYPTDSELGPLQKHFIRYFLARWAPYSCWWHWTIDSEYEETGKGSDIRVRTFAREMQKLNPWRTLLTTHVLRNWSFDYAPEMDFATIQRRVEDNPAGITDCKKFITQNFHSDIPVYNSEGVWNLQSTDFSRIASLNHLFAGGYSHIAHWSTDKNYTGSWNSIWETLVPRHKEDAEMLGKLTRFFNSENCYDFNRCLPADELTKVSDGNDALCLADRGRTYYIYLERGGKLSLDLRDTKGVYEVFRYRGNQLDKYDKLSNVKAGSIVNIDHISPLVQGHDYIYIVRNKKPAKPSVTILTNQLPDAIAEEPYHFGLKYRDAADQPYWSITKGTLPQGLVIEKGVITGVPSEFGSFTFILKAESANQKDERSFHLKVHERPSKLPLITGVRATEQYPDSLLIEWRTDIPATSRVQWGDRVGNYTGESGEFETNTTSHKVMIKDKFNNGQMVYLLVISTNEAGKTALYEAVITVKMTQE